MVRHTFYIIICSYKKKMSPKDPWFLLRLYIFSSVFLFSYVCVSLSHYCVTSCFIFNTYPHYSPLWNFLFSRQFYLYNGIESRNKTNESLIPIKVKVRLRMLKNKSYQKVNDGACVIRVYEWLVIILQVDIIRIQIDTDPILSR